MSEERGALSREAGADVIRVRSALTNVYLKRGDRELYMTLRKSDRELQAAFGSDVSLLEGTIELEVLDSETGQRLAVGLTVAGRHGEPGLEERPTTWTDFTWQLKLLSLQVAKQISEAMMLPE